MKEAVRLPHGFKTVHSVRMTMLRFLEMCRSSRESALFTPTSFDLPCGTLNNRRSSIPGFSCLAMTLVRMRFLSAAHSRERLILSSFGLQVSKLLQQVFALSICRREHILVHGNHIPVFARNFGQPNALPWWRSWNGPLH
jgi:hypothetical protein